MTPQIIKHRRPVANVITKIIDATMHVDTGAHIFRGSLSTNLPHKRRNNIAINAETLKKYEAVMPRSLANCTKRNCPASLKANNATDIAKKII